MAANEFEKNVRKEMAEFKLQPSGEVWLKVEERLREKKRRRRVIFFILSSSIALMLMGYGIYHFSNGNTKPGIENKFSQKNNPEVNTTNEKENSIVIESNAHHEKMKQNETNTIASPQKNTYQHKQRDEKINRSIAQSKTHTYPQGEKQKVINEAKQIEKLVPANNKSVTIENNIEKSIVDQGTNLHDTAQQITMDLKEERTAGIPDTIETKNGESKRDEAAITEHTKPTEKKKLSKKIVWGTGVSMGSSTIGETAFALDNSKSLADMQYSVPGNSAGGGQPNNYRGPQSENKPAFAFKIGAVARKDISPRSSLSVGLAYSYLADKITIGPKQYPNGVFNLAPSYYINASSQTTNSSQLQTYTDQFHFIELPVLYHWRMTKNPVHFLSLNAGVSPSYLLSSNALVYDTTLGGIYYSGKDLIQKAHFNFVSGLSYQFMISKDLRFNVGPQLSFDLTKIFKSEFDNRKYLLYTGINAGIFFEKKKK